MARTRNGQDGRIATQRRFIAEMRAMHPDDIMTRRLDALERELDQAEGKLPAAV